MEPQLTLGKGLKFGLFLLSDLGFPVDEAAPTPNKEGKLFYSPIGVAIVFPHFGNEFATDPGTSLVDVQRIPYKV